MFIAMNRFKVNAGHEDGFEGRWRGRDTYLQDVPGFLAFSLLRNATTADGITEFLSHSTWRSRDDFEAWRTSESFRMAHSQGSVQGVLAGPPEALLYEVVINESREKAGI